MRRTVVLLHTTEHSPDHYDWLIDQPDLEIEHRLRTFRVMHRPDIASGFIAENAPDHRAIYLEYQGELSAQRGRVTRVAEGTVQTWEEEGDSIRARINWGDGLKDYVARLEGGKWAFRSID